MTLVWSCPHCRNRYHGTSRFRMNVHKLRCWPADSPFWDEGEREELLDDEFLVESAERSREYQIER